ncbi:MAG: DUF3501 family protein [Actinobacteria bacterium]|nr:DUF3501 family protein [Actinomycetota bacterium]
MTRLTVDDIADLRAYERDREDFRSFIIDLKSRRRVGVGPLVSFVFENRDTIRFQIQEMARAERLLRDDQIEAELRVYNPLIPEPGHLAATMFLELTADEQLRHWLPRLVGVEADVELRIGAGADGTGGEAVRCIVDPDHAEQLTRDDTTASVHYVHFALGTGQVERFAASPVALAVTHPAYQHATLLGDASHAELLADLRGG